MVLQFQVRSNIAIPESIIYIVPCDHKARNYSTAHNVMAVGDFNITSQVLNKMFIFYMYSISLLCGIFTVNNNDEMYYSYDVTLQISKYYIF